MPARALKLLCLIAAITVALALALAPSPSLEPAAILGMGTVLIAGGIYARRRFARQR
jgi:hypothetical protein